MHTDERTNPEKADVFFDSNLLDVPEVQEGSATTHTTSHLIAWYLCHFHGYHLHHKTYAPKSGFLGAVSYRTTWWLHD